MCLSFLDPSISYDLNLTHLRPVCTMSFKNFREYLAWLYYQYLLITGIYVLEPWEKSIFNSILFSAIAMVVYTSYVFVPIHVRLALEFFSGIFGDQPQSTMALMNWRRQQFGLAPGRKKKKSSAHQSWNCLYLNGTFWKSEPYCLFLHPKPPWPYPMVLDTPQHLTFTLLMWKTLRKAFCFLFFVFFPVYLCFSGHTSCVSACYQGVLHERGTCGWYICMLP